MGKREGIDFFLEEVTKERLEDEKKKLEEMDYEDEKEENEYEDEEENDEEELNETLGVNRPAISKDEFKDIVEMFKNSNLERKEEIGYYVLDKIGTGLQDSFLDSLIKSLKEEDCEDEEELEEMSQVQKVGSHKTTVSTDKDGKTRVTYHNTDVVTFDDETIELDTGGYKTLTTKTRMNQAANEYGLGYAVYQRKGQWFVDYDGETIPFEGDSVTLERKDIKVEETDDEEIEEGSVTAIKNKKALMKADELKDAIKSGKEDLIQSVMQSLHNDLKLGDIATEK